ncbi:MAG: 30S ribosomal protein S16 [Bacteroidetes bacterium]|nr:30S ribosomal protein S16 [Bacteroidota bacterium]
MPTKIRLQRKGKKGQPFYHIVIADGRAPRDGKFIERIGTYNPLTKPADINMDFDRALYWLQTGAQPTDTVRAIFSYQGVLYKNHLAKGVKKGALSQEQADVKFNDWLREKREKIESKTKQVELDKKGESKKRLEAEKKVNEDRAEQIAKKRAAELKAEAAKEKAAEEAITPTVETEMIAETQPEEPQQEEPKEDNQE